MVVFFTIWLPLSFKETCGAQLALTHPTHKVLRVPYFSQCCDHLQHETFSITFVHTNIFCTMLCHSVLNILFHGFTFPTMHLLQEAQWPLAAVRTPIFSKSELRPPSRSSIMSVFLLRVEGFASLLLFSCCFFSSFLFTDCFGISGGGLSFS